MKTTKKNNTDSIGSLSLSDSILSGATITSQPAGYTFPHHLHSTIEIYRIISGECLMDVQSETLHCTKGDFIMILPNIVHSFLSEPKKSDCTFKHVHFDPNMFSNIILENEGVYPITLMHAVLFSSHFYYRFSADDVIDSTLDKLISLYTDSDGLFPAANINISLINLMLYILDHTKPAHHFFKPAAPEQLCCLHAELYCGALYREDHTGRYCVTASYFCSLFKQTVQGAYRNHSLQLY